VKLDQPDWGEHSHSLAVTVEVRPARLRVHFILNAYWEPLDVELPPPGPWRRRIDTFLDSPDDIVDWELAPLVPGLTYRAEPRSVVLLFADQA
jgi:glycogen operon protein